MEICSCNRAGLGSWGHPLQAPASELPSHWHSRHGFFRYGQDAAALADATLETATLVHLASNDTDAASETLRLQLHAALETLAASESRLTPDQKLLLSKIRRESEPFLGRSGSHTGK